MFDYKTFKTLGAERSCGGSCRGSSGSQHYSSGEVIHFFLPLAPSLSDE
jgi:hypothetical protein